VDEKPELRQVTFAEAKRYAQSVDATCIEASARDGTNVDAMFASVVEACLNKQDKQASEMKQNFLGGGGSGHANGGGKNVNLSGGAAPKKKKCC
jgi:hypothetical protein